MKRLLTFCLLLPLLSLCQPTMEDLNKTLGESYVDFDLSRFIKTPYDFDQSGLKEEEIEVKIENILKAQETKSLMDIATPLNSKRLHYLGKIHPVKTNLFYEDQNYFLNKDEAIKGDSFYTYQYEHLYLATKSNTLLDRYLIYYAIRDLLIVKYRYSVIYQFLFEKPKAIPVNYVAIKPEVPYINTTQNIFVLFNGVLTLPSNNAYFGPLQVGFAKPIYGVEIYPNTQVMYFNRTTILNGGAAGTIPIYTSTTNPSEKFHAYMKDGFIHSFIHERIHDWIFEYSNFNLQAYYLRTGCQESGAVPQYYPFEEAVVNNTSNILFEMYPKNGGLSSDVLEFYQKEFELSIRSFQSTNSYQKLKTELTKYNSTHCQSPCPYQRSASYAKSDDNKVFFIDFYSRQNNPL
jgi:hypothetical protein